MLDFDDPLWSELLGGYRVPYDPRRALRALESQSDPPEAWSELWDELHHQGNVDSASYAAVPHLVRIHEIRDVPDWNTYALVGIIHLAKSEANPPVPNQLGPAYADSLSRLADLAAQDLSRSSDPPLVQSALGIIALSAGLEPQARILLTLASDELEEMLVVYSRTAGT